ncbi:hypothetical protein [Rhizobium leguminosarum]|uniref:hypothetical protein n=1 Tax=Rhizobium leguminosarum TaxID=384 RepID=UPI0021BBCE95|nr:hypothetical protein [Rhizobium leguminosarum]
MNNVKIRLLGAQFPGRRCMGLCHRLSPSICVREPRIERAGQSPQDLSQELPGGGCDVASGVYFGLFNIRTSYDL